MDTKFAMRPAAGFRGWLIGLGLGAGLLPISGAQQDAQQRDGRVSGGSVDFTRSEIEQILEFSPLPEPPEDLTNAVYRSAAATQLGRALFFDRRFSANGQVSCATCHDPDQDWTDGRQFALGIENVPRNTMSLWNVAHNRWFYWDGRRDSLWAQALTPIEAPEEHGFSRLETVHLLAADPDYRRAYGDTFGELPDFSDATRFPEAGRPVAADSEHPHDKAWRSMGLGDREQVNRAFANFGKAIAAFERGIISRNSPFDQYVQGLREGDAEKQRALGDSALQGLRLFIGKARCALCHNGPNFTDLEFHNDRVPELLSETQRVPGRYAGVALVQGDPFNGIGIYSDNTEGEARAKVGYLLKDGHAMAEFKTPSLRNVANTAPYMRQGQLKTLEDVIEFYNDFEGALPIDKGAEKLLVPLGLSAEERGQLRDFLIALSGPPQPMHKMGPPKKPYLE